MEEVLSFDEDDDELSLDDDAPSEADALERLSVRKKPDPLKTTPTDP